MSKIINKILFGFCSFSLVLFALAASGAVFPSIDQTLSTSANWVWMKGANITNQPGTYGTQGVADPANTPGARAGAVSWTGNSGALWLFGGRGYASIGFGELNDLWKYDLATTNWTWMKGANTNSQPETYGTQGVPAPANTPGARNGAVSWTDNTGALWLFGGGYFRNIGGWVELNDLWKYDYGMISLATNALVFSATCQDVNPAAQIIGMTNVGGTEFTYTNVITYGAGASGWLTVLPVAGTVALNGATVLTNYVNITGLSAGTYYATNHVTSADARNSPQAVVVTLTVSDIITSLCADLDGDGLADLITVVGSNWYVWFSTSHYLVRYGPYDLGISGKPAAGDIDGDGIADLINVVGSNWYVWFSTSHYLVRCGPYDLGISGTPATGDLDGDGQDDLISVVGSNWYVWFSSLGYLQRIGPIDLGISGTPTTGDLDGDGLSDLISVVGGTKWYVWFSSSHYLVRNGPYTLSVP